MAQHDYIIANQSGAAFRADLNNALAAIVSQNSGAAEPSTTYAYQWWGDTTTGLLKIRNAANSAWVTVGTLADANLGLLATTGGTLTGDLTLNAQSDLRFADSDSSNWVAFQGAATISSNVTWTLPSADGTDGQKLSTDGSGVLSWTASAPAITYLTSGTGATYTPTSGTKAIYVEVVGGGGGGGGVDGQGAGTGAAAASGGGGGYTAKLITSPAASYTYTIGAGGSAGASTAGDGGNGGTTTFTDGTLTLTATGGSLGIGYTATSGNSTGTAGGQGGLGSGGDVNLQGGRAGNRSVASGLVVSLSTSGSAPFFGGGRVAAIGNAGEAGVNYGEGGSGGAVYNVTTNYAGGAGAAGVIRITEYF